MAKDDNPAGTPGPRDPDTGRDRNDRLDRRRPRRPGGRPDDPVRGRQVGRPVDGEHDDDTGEVRRPYVIGVVKIPAEQRDVARRVLGNPRARYRGVLRSDNETPDLIGQDAAYTAWLTDAEAAEFAQASNVRYVDPEGIVSPDVVTIPEPATLAWMGASLTEQGAFTGSGVKVAVLDGGVSTAVLAQVSWTRVARKTFPAALPPTTEIMGDHGCLVAPEAVPPAGQLIDGMIAYDTDGHATWADSAAGMIWAADQGAKVINYSFSAAPTGVAGVIQDAFAYCRNLGVQITCSAGNDNLPDLNYPANQCRVFPNVHSIGAINPADNQLAYFSCRHWDMSGVTLGMNMLSLRPDGTTRTWQGTSSSAPKAALLIAMGCTGGTYTPQQVAHALRHSARQLSGLTRDQQGYGAWHLANALALLVDSARPRPGDHMRRTRTTAQPIPRDVPTKVAFPVERETSTDVTANSAFDVFTVQRAGKYRTVTGCRWQPAATAPGERYLGIGNDIDWTQPGSKRPAADCRPGTTAPMHMSVCHEQRYAVGDKIVVWAWHNATGYTQWDLQPGVGHVDNESTSISITRTGD